MSLIIGSINNELNIIKAKYREAGECSESYIKYYNQVEQPTQVKEIITGKLIDFDYFGGYSDRLIDPLVYWNGFFIQPYRITALSDLIKERKIFHNDKIITDINEISEYIFAYKEGFDLGYEKFDSIEIENKSSVFKSDKLSIDKIINYIENHKESDNGGFTFHYYTESKDFLRGKSKCVFKQQNGTCSEMKGEQPRNICEWCDLKTLPELNRWKSKGIESGKYYRAWFIVLANFQIFDEYYKSKIPDNGKIEDFINYLNTPKSKELLIFLKKEFPTGKNKEAAIMVFALSECERISPPKNQIDLRRSIGKEWNIVVDKRDESFDRELRNFKITKHAKEKDNSLKYDGDIIAAINKINQFDCN